jgi:FkbM family methyltransferase
VGILTRNPFKVKTLLYTYSMSYSNSDCNGVALDRKLDDLFHQKTNGFFIELGANNGIDQSNTAFFEKTRDWQGILIEPSVSGYHSCCENRRNSICLNHACVSDEYDQETIQGDFMDCHLMSSVDGTRLNRSHLCKVQVKTLTNILDKHYNGANIDLLSLDVEGYELNVLQGLDMNKYRPNYMLIEIYTHDYDRIVEYLMTNGYDCVCNFSNYSLNTNPHWDGTHNDYLFVDKHYTPPPI